MHCLFNSAFNGANRIPCLTISQQRYCLGRDTVPAIARSVGDIARNGRYLRVDISTQHFPNI